MGADESICSRNRCRSTDLSIETLCGEAENCRLYKSDVTTAARQKHAVLQKAGIGQCRRDALYS